MCARTFFSLLSCIRFFLSGVIEAVNDEIHAIAPEHQRCHWVAESRDRSSFNILYFLSELFWFYLWGTVLTWWVAVSRLVFVHFFPVSVWALLVRSKLGAPTSQIKSWWAPCDSLSFHMHPANINFAAHTKKIWMHVYTRTGLKVEKKVSEFVLPSIRFGCKASTHFFLCCLGVSLLSISIGELLNWVVHRNPGRPN